jgi:HK97 family phage portal protein
VSFVSRVVRGAGIQASGGREIVERLFEGMVDDSSSKGPISVERSLTLGAVFKALRLFSETPGAMPLFPYRRDGDASERATSHSAYGLLHDKPNPGEDAVPFWTAAFLHLGSWGKLFIGKEKVGNRVVGLHRLDPWRVSVDRLPNGGLLFKESRREGGTTTWSQQDVIYVPLFTLDGVNGLSPIGLARETVRLGLNMRDHGVRTFDESAIPAGSLNTKEVIKEKGVRDRMRKEFKERHQGKRDIAILDAGAEFKTYTLPFDDVQFVQLHASTKADVADYFNMPASLLGGKTADSMTYGNRQDDVQQFLTYTLHNPLRKVEQALSNDRDLFPQPNTFFAEFLREGLLQPTPVQKAAYYRQALDPKTGWMTRAEVRGKENLPREEAAPASTALIPNQEEEPDATDD